VKPQMGAEDFALFAQKVPALYLRMASARSEGDPRADPHAGFRHRRDVLPLGVRAMATLVWDYMARTPLMRDGRRALAALLLLGHGRLPRREAAAPVTGASSARRSCSSAGGRFEWNVVLPLLRQGKLPALASLIRRGATGRWPPSGRRVAGALDHDRDRQDDREARHPRVPQGEEPAGSSSRARTAAPRRLEHLLGPPAKSPTVRLVRLVSGRGGSPA